MNIGLIIGGLVVLIILTRKLYRYLQAPYTHTNISERNLPKFLEALLNRGRDGAFLIIKDPHSDRFLQFSKYIKKPGDYGIELSFPNADWSKQYYDEFQSYLKSNGLPLVIQKTEVEAVEQFTDVDFGRDVEKAATVVKGVFRDVYKRNEYKMTFNIDGSDISPLEEVISACFTLVVGLMMTIAILIFTKTYGHAYAQWTYRSPS